MPCDGAVTVQKHCQEYDYSDMKYTEASITGALDTSAFLKCFQHCVSLLCALNGNTTQSGETKRYPKTSNMQEASSYFGAEMLWDVFTRNPYCILFRYLQSA